MRTPPDDVLASWPEPNYVNPATRGDGLIIVNVVTIVLAAIVVLLRVYTRLKITGSFGVDDLLILFALVFAISMITATTIASENYGWDRHLWDIEPWKLKTGNKLNLMFQISFCFASTATKISLLWFCKRLLGTRPKGLYRRYNHVIIASMITVPMSAYWDFRPQYPHKCLNEGNNMFAASIVNIFTDLLVTVVPMPLIWSLKLPWRERVAVISVFGLGIMVNVAGSIRTVLVYRSSIASYDETWGTWPMVLVSALEINLGLICASVPALRPLFAFYAPQLFQISLSNDNSGSPGATNNRVRKLRKSGSCKDSGVVISSSSQAPVIQQAQTQNAGDFSDFRDLHDSHLSHNVQDTHILDDDLNGDAHSLQEFHGEGGGLHTIQAFHDSPSTSNATPSIEQYHDVENPYSPTDSIGIFRPTNVECWYEERETSESGISISSRSWRREERQPSQSRFDDDFSV